MGEEDFVERISDKSLRRRWRPEEKYSVKPEWGSTLSKRATSRLPISYLHLAILGMDQKYGRLDLRDKSFIFFIQGLSRLDGRYYVIGPRLNAAESRFCIKTMGRGDASAHCRIMNPQGSCLRIGRRAVFFPT